MMKFVAAIGALIVLLVAIVLLAPNLVPAQSYKGRLEAEASKALGRKVTLGDDISFMIVPKTAFRVSDLDIANADGFDGDYLIRVGAADIGVKLFSLFSGSVEIERFILTEPQINLQKKADGRVNWEIGAPPAESASPAGQSGAEPTDVRLGDVRIVRGQAIYADAAAGQKFAMDDINIAVRLASLSEPLEVQGDMIFQGAPSTVDLVLTTPADLSARRPANMKFDIKLGDAALAADLALEGGEALAYSGPVNINAPDLRALARLMGVEIADAPGFDKLNVSGTAKGSDTRIALSAAKINFDAIDATGDLAMDWAGARPKAAGSLDVGALDLRPYLPPPTETAAGFPAWSEEKLDLTSLRTIDANFDIRADSVLLNDIRAGASRLTLTIENGRMVAEIPQLGLYNGGGSGRLVVNAAGAVPSFSGVFDLSSVQAEPFAKDVLKNDRLLGLGGLKFDFTASGASQAAIMSSLNGKGGFDLNDGALKGINIAALASGVASVIEGGLSNPAAIAAAVANARRPAEATEFTKFLSQFTIESGVMNAPTINLEGPFLSMTGVGSVNLPAQTMDLRLAPRGSTTADGASGRSIAIPLRISGTFNQPTVAVDVESLVRGKVESSVRDLIGGAVGARPGEGPATVEDAAKSLLQGAIGGRRPAQTPPAQTQPAPEGAAAPAAAPQPSASEAIATEALGRLFGGRKTATTAPKEEPAAEPAKQPE